MKKSLSFLFFLCVLFFSCNNEDKVPNRTIFTFTSNFANPNTDYWIILRDNSSGNLIDSRQITVDRTAVTFESTKPISNNKMDVTIFQGTPNSTNGNAVAQVYTGVDVGSEWMAPYKGYSPTPPNYGGTAGQYDLKISGVPSLVSFNVSDQFGYVGIGTSSYTYTAGNITCKPTITGNGHTQLISIDIGSGKSKYAMVDNPTDGKAIVIDYSTFKEYDKYINVTFPNTALVSIDVYGYEEGSPINFDSYLLQQYRYSGAAPVKMSEWNIGVLNSLEKYSIGLEIMGSFLYTSYGPAPTSIQYVSPDVYQVSATTKDDYTITSSTSFTFRAADFGYTEGSRSIDFSYFVPQGYQGKHYDAIGSDLAKKYGIDLSKLSYQGTTFTNGRSYDVMLEYRFTPTFDPYSPYSETQVYKSGR